VCGTVWCGFRVVCLCCMWDSLLLVFWSECLLFEVQFVVGLVGVSLCCVWDSFLLVFGSEFVLCVVEFGMGLGE